MIKLARLNIWSIKAVIAETITTTTTANGTAVGALIGDSIIEASSMNNGTVPELAEALSDNTTTTESTETAATTTEERLATHVQQYNYTESP